MGYGHGNDGGRNMTKYFEGGGALYGEKLPGGELTRDRGHDGSCDRDTTYGCQLTQGKLNFVNKSRP